MASPDQDYCELFVSVRNYFNGQPYVDTSIGQTSLNIPIESCTINDVMYEPQASQMSTAVIKFPTIITNPSLYPLLIQLKEGDRVEIYNFQPDCGLPVFAGFIPPGGITVDAGNMTIQLQDVLGRGQWERIRPYEDFDTDADGYYTRAMHRWQDYMNENFDVANATSSAYTTMYNITHSGTIGTITQGKMRIGPGQDMTLSTNQSGAPLLTFTPGQRVLIEARGQSFTDFKAVGGPLAVIVNELGLHSNSVSDDMLLEEIYYSDGATPPVNGDRVVTTQANYGLTFNQVPLYTSPPTGTAQQIVAIGVPANNLYSLLVTCLDDGSLTVSTFINYIQVGFLSGITASLNGYYFFIHSACIGTGNTYQEWYNIRVRYLTPWLTRASQFNPQTNDATEFQANNDDLYTFLNNFAEIDFAEYRPIYQPYPALDQLELDGVGLLGINASHRLGIDKFMDESAPRTGGVIGTEVADFEHSPAFRFEEGWNLADFPHIQKSQLLHANDIVRMGSGNQDAQNFFDRWNATEVGNPFGNQYGTITGAAPQYPYFETLINDDRTSLPDVIQTLAQNDLIVRAAGTVPTLALSVSEDLRWAFKYRAGDFARVKTQSLIPNVDTDLRIMTIAHQAGNPTRDIIVGKLPYDPAMRRLMATAMVESWLYTQSGAGQLVLIYPFVPITLTPGSLGNTFQIPLNQFTTGTAITYAAFHWFMNGSDQADAISIAVSGNDPTLANGTQLATASSTQDSGLQNATGLFPAPGLYYAAPKNVSGGSVTMNSMYLIIKKKQ